jgi:hypothetical protein
MTKISKEKQKSKRTGKYQPPFPKRELLKQKKSTEPKKIEKVR